MKRKKKIRNSIQPYHTHIISCIYIYIIYTTLYARARENNSRLLSRASRARPEKARRQRRRPPFEPFAIIPVIGYHGGHRSPVVLNNRTLIRHSEVHSRFFVRSPFDSNGTPEMHPLRAGTVSRMEMRRMGLFFADPFDRGLYFSFFPHYSFHSVPPSHDRPRVVLPGTCQLFITSTAVFSRRWASTDETTQRRLVIL